MKNIETQYRSLIKELLDAPYKPDRTGTGTYSLFGKTLEHDMSAGFPLLLSKKVSFKAAKFELLWILQGRTDIQYLRDNGINYWDPDYKRSGRTDGTLGPVYGKQWRNFNGVDQLERLIVGIMTKPESRRLIVNAWNPPELHQMALPPCHYGFQVYINNNQLDLMWQQRSADVFLGLPYDIAMYGLLLELLAKGAGCKPGRLIAQLGDCHLYSNHREQSKELLGRQLSGKVLPVLDLSGTGLTIGYGREVVVPHEWEIELKHYDPMPAIKAPLSVGM
jgi:thymidylate synthase